ncbi:hypothetical protein MSAN_02118400 [Mycena sanguinolenta]|uniref:F-box domain-containing protein n=1 Tax=Mycena sanguinolenta TaxID=230812 RepID=A0A8H6XHS5_9AGAR|nr:hypothetical protein MSAN_02118400 [Mycena sanguinolenta]
MVLTRRAHREKMEIFRWLPNEILVRIIQQSGTADQATLCRLSKLFRDLCLPVLHRDVTIKGPRAIASFCSAILENPSRADAVRSLTLDVPYYEPDVNHGDLILATLKLMWRLEHLSVSLCTLEDHHWANLLERGQYTQLTSCDLWVPTDAPVILPTRPSDLAVSFLTRHPTLKRVRFIFADRIVPSQSVRVSLPNLEFYRGDAEFIVAIDAICLKAVDLIWYSEDNVENIIVALSSITQPDLPFISSHELRSWGGLRQIVTSLSKHMPHTQTLRLACLRGSLRQDTIRHITESLPRFTGLVHLQIGYYGDFFQMSTPGGSDEDRIVVESWGEACPTLEACCLNYLGWRKVDSRWEEFPIKEFWVLAGLSDIGY